MEKAGLKTFVYSFVFSLFAVFGANSLYLRTLPSHRAELKIPNKNVTLFLKDLGGGPQQIRAVPAKKITLSILPEIKKEATYLVDEIPLNIDELIEEEPSYKMAEIPLETIKKRSREADVDQLKKELPNTAKTVSAEVPIISEKIISNFDDVIKKAPPVNEAELLKTANKNTEEPQYTSPQPVLQEEFAALPEAHRPTLLSQNSDATADAISAIKRDEPLEDNLSAPQLLIPLEKDHGIIRTANREIKIVNGAEANQVALNSSNVPIKSMTEKKTISPQAKKTERLQWHPMSEKTPVSANDNLWLVAKGAKNPKNNLILESEGYKQDEKDIKRILSGENDSESKINGQPVELAAETVKNLLIPIPEDILKDDNLTPQLASSPKNKAIEEKLNADIADGHYNDDYDDMNDTAVSDTKSGGSKSGILDSLSSIFSSKDKKIPEIGSSVENSNEDGSSLFSAFSGRKVRKKRSARILPTEMRLSFQPNRAEISGQTLKWIRAFANKINEEKLTGLEIRIDGTSSPALQQRRLNLLQNILTGEKVNYNKINTVFTSREPNSFIIRTVKINPRTENVPENYLKQTNNRYQQW